MKRRGLLWQLYIPYLLTTILSLVCFGGLAAYFIADLFEVAVAKVAAGQSSSQSELFHIYLWLSGAWVAIAAVAALATWFVARKLTRPLREMRIGAKRFARGDLTFRLPVIGSDDLSGLAEALNVMASQLDERIRLILSQRNEQQAVLASMVEGVVALDSRGAIININEAAKRLLHLGDIPLQHKSIHELIRNYQLHQFISQALNSSEPLEADITLSAPEHSCLQVHGTPLRTESGEGRGIVVVLNDVTRLRKLEDVRRDFVANVSHELRTPVTSIKGFVETLLDGALDNPEDARRFLGIILRQVNSLNSIIEDLLRLSRLEQDSENGTIPTSPTILRDVLEEVVELVGNQLTDKGVRVAIDCSPLIEAYVNRTLFEQAVVNLVENAIKYSERNKEVLISAKEVGEELVLQVKDEGWGIERQHLPRLFERFYRVDRARDKRSGGTGLGLSIVKHVIAAHRGRIEVDSAPGKGSTFRICLPLSRPAEGCSDTAPH